MSIETLLSKLSKVRRRSAGQWMACCPVHQERTPSLSIKDDNGKIIMMCFGCGAKGPEIAGALGMDISELFPPRDTYDASVAHPQKRQYFPADQVLEALMFEGLVIRFTAEDMAKGKQVDMERLIVANSRVAAAMEFVKGNK